MANNGAPFSGPSEDELLQMLMQYQGGSLPGKTPASQLNYYQDLSSTLGFDPVQQAGLGDEPAPAPYDPSPSQQRLALGSNPIYKEVFDRIDAGSDPLSAFNETKKAHAKDKNGPVWDDPTTGQLSDDAKSIKKAATDYAFENAQNAVDEHKYNTKNAPTNNYTKADGSKYKNAPLGGNGIFDTASEYDLLGQPTTADLLQGYVKDHPTLVRPGANQDTAYHAKNDASTYMPAGSVGAMKGDNHVNINGEAIGRIHGTTPRIPAGTASALGMKQETVDPRPFGGDKITNDAFKMQSQVRIDKTKNTQVRSDANNNAMRRILALRAILGA